MIVMLDVIFKVNTVTVTHWEVVTLLSFVKWLSEIPREGNTAKIRREKYCKEYFKNIENIAKKMGKV